MRKQQFETIGQQRWREDKLYLKVTLVAVGLCAVAAVTADNKTVTPREAFAKDYTATNKCLDNTPYDTAKGAITAGRDIDGQAALTVVPVTANHLTPAVLNFGVVRTGFLNHMSELRPNDNVTDGFLAVKCGENGS